MLLFELVRFETWTFSPLHFTSFIARQLASSFYCLSSHICLYGPIDMPLLTTVKTRRSAVKRRENVVRRSSSTLSLSRPLESTKPTASKRIKKSSNVDVLGLRRPPLDPQQRRENWTWLQWTRISGLAVKLGIVDKADLDSGKLLPVEVAPRVYQEVVSLRSSSAHEHGAFHTQPCVTDFNSAIYTT